MAEALEAIEGTGAGEDNGERDVGGIIDTPDLTNAIVDLRDVIVAIALTSDTEAQEAYRRIRNERHRYNYSKDPDVVPPETFFLGQPEKKRASPVFKRRRVHQSGQEGEGRDAPDSVE